MGSLFFYQTLCVCGVCVCERERVREKDWKGTLSETNFRHRGGKSLWVHVCVCVWVRVCEWVCVCVCERETEWESVSNSLSENLLQSIVQQTTLKESCDLSLSLSLSLLTHTHFLDLFGVTYFAYDRQAIVCQPSITVWIQIGHNTEWDKSCCCCNLHRLLSGLSIINSILGFQCKWIYWKIFLTTMLMEKPKPN